MNLAELKRELSGAADPAKAKILAGFFKTGKGEYGEGDKFLGLQVPVQRKAAKKFFGLSRNDLEQLLSSKIHEYRLTALLILVDQYGRGDEKKKKEIFDFYLGHLKSANNWDLVDLSAPNIVGDYLLGRDRKILYRLARSKNLWERRVAMVATYAFIRQRDLDDVFKIAETLLDDKHDLIHKAVGWMLREAGKKNERKLENFLAKYGSKMPRTMLRYAIEKFPEKKRKFYLVKK